MERTNLMKNLLKKYGPYIAIILILFFWFQSCENQKATISDLKTELSIDSLDFVNVVDSKNKLIAKQNIKIISDKNTMKRLVDEVEGVRKINKQIKATVHTKIIRVPVSSIGGEPEVKRDTTTREDSTQTIDHFMKLPQSYAINNEWFGFQYSIDTNGQSIIDTALFVTKPIVSFGYKDQGFVKNVLKQPIPVVTWQDQNPYSEVKGLQNLEYKPKIKWYQRKGVAMAVGFVGGVYVTYKITKL